MATHSQLEHMLLREVSRELATWWRGENEWRRERPTWHAEGADWTLEYTINFSPVDSPMVNSSGFKGTSPCPPAAVCDWRNIQQRWRGGGGKGGREGKRKKINRMRGGAGDSNFFLIFFLQQIGWKVGGCDDKVKEMLCGGGRCAHLCVWGYFCPVI